MPNYETTVFVFDLDGVITDPKDSSVDEAVIEVMYSLMTRGNPVAVNTGRSYDWVEKNLVARLKLKENSDVFQQFIAVCEKGGELVEWENGNPSVKSSEFALSRHAYDVVQKCYEDNKSTLKTMFWDNTKRTMATIEKNPSSAIELFQEEQQQLIELLTHCLSGHDVRIDPTTIATDVEQPSAGKYAGASLISKWASSNFPSFTSYVSVGDSISDYAMAEYFAEHSENSTFVYVGKSTNQIEHDPRVNFIATKMQYSDGTLEFFGNQQLLSH